VGGSFEVAGRFASGLAFRVIRPTLPLPALPCRVSPPRLRNSNFSQFRSAACLLDVAGGCRSGNSAPVKSAAALTHRSRCRQPTELVTASSDRRRCSQQSFVGVPLRCSTANGSGLKTEFATSRQNARRLTFQQSGVHPVAADSPCYGNAVPEMILSAVCP